MKKSQRRNRVYHGVAVAALMTINYVIPIPESNQPIIAIIGVISMVILFVSEMKPDILGQNKFSSKKASVTKDLPVIFHYDKVQHFTGGMVLALIFSVNASFGIALAWEIKDMIVSYKKNILIFGYNIGGEGYSMIDLISTIAGSITITILI
jgi:hypothetical protein